MEELKEILPKALSLIKSSRAWIVGASDTAALNKLSDWPLALVLIAGMLFWIASETFLKWKVKAR